MRCLLISFTLACQITASAAEISGPLYFKGTLKEQVSVGYVALVAGGIITNMAGLTPAGATGEVWCDTFKPRRTGVRWNSATGLTFQHTNLPPGRYLLYAKYGQNYLAWRVVKVPEASASVTASLGINLGQTGDIRFEISKGVDNYSIVLVPLTEKYQSPLPGLGLDDVPGVEVEFTGKSVVLAGVKPGSYRVTLRSGKLEGKPQTGVFTTYTDLGEWSATLKAGEVLSSRIP